jgi:hypothetical protein
MKMYNIQQGSLGLVIQAGISTWAIVKSEIHDQVCISDISECKSDMDGFDWL